MCLVYPEVVSDSALQWWKQKSVLLPNQQMKASLDIPETLQKPKTFSFWRTGLFHAPGQTRAVGKSCCRTTPMKQAYLQQNEQKFLSKESEPRHVVWAWCACPMLNCVSELLMRGGSGPNAHPVLRRTMSIVYSVKNIHESRCWIAQSMLCVFAAPLIFGGFSALSGCGHPL